jgi:hypothetical protein
MSPSKKPVIVRKKPKAKVPKKKGGGDPPFIPPLYIHGNPRTKTQPDYCPPEPVPAYEEPIRTRVGGKPKAAEKVTKKKGGVHVPLLDIHQQFQNADKNPGHKYEEPIRTRVGGKPKAAEKVTKKKVSKK